MVISEWKTSLLYSHQKKKKKKKNHTAQVKEQRFMNTHFAAKSNALNKKSNE